MRRNSRTLNPGLVSALAVAAVLMSGSAASARTESLRWHHVSPSEVSGYRIHLRTSPGSYVMTIEVGSLPADGENIVTYTLTVPPSLGDSTLYVAVTAYDGDGSSIYSNERIFGGPGPEPLGAPGAPFLVQKRTGEAE